MIHPSHPGHFWCRKPPHVAVHPLVKLAFDECDRRRLPRYRVEEKAGVANATMRAWRRGQTPAIHNLEAVLNTLGYELRAVKVGEGG